MARPIDNHPIPFNLETQCGILDTRYIQPVQCDDVSQFQFALDICAAEKTLLGNGSFTDPTQAPWSLTIGTSFVYDGTAGTMTKINGDISAFSQNVTVTDGQPIQITFECEVFFGVFIIWVGNEIIPIEASGSYNFWVVADSITGIAVFANAEAEFVVRELNMYAINTNFLVQVLDNDDAVVRTLDPVTHSGYFNFADGFFTFSFDWIDELGECLADGCYYFKVSDPCDCGNGGFVASDFVTVNNQWQGDLSAWNFLFGICTFNGLAPTTATIYVDNVVCGGEDYELTYTLGSMNAGNAFQIRLGAQLGVLQTVNGTYTETITALGTLLSRVNFIGTNGGGGLFNVTDFSIKRVPRSFEFESVKLKLKATHVCTSFVHVCNNNNGLNGGFVGTGFAPRIRIAAMYGLGTYDEESNEYELDNGRKDRYYFRGRKVRKFAYNVPEYVHDFMATVRGYHHAYIDGVEVYIEGDDYPDPNYKDNWNQGDVTLDVSLKETLTENVDLGGGIKTCETDGQGVVLIVDGGAGDGAALSTEAEGVLTNG